MENLEVRYYPNIPHIPHGYRFLAFLCFLLEQSLLSMQIAITEILKPSEDAVIE